MNREYNKMRSTNTIVFLPRKVFNIYIIITLLLFLFGPINYNYISLKESCVCCVYMLLFLLMSSIAYKFGVSKKVYNKKTSLYVKKTKIKAFDIVRLSLIYSVIIYSLLIYENISAHGSISFSGFNYFSIMAQSYTDIEFEVTLAGRIICYTAIFRVISIVGSVYYWKELSHLYKLLTTMLFTLIVLNNVFFVGSQKQIIDLFIYVLIAFVANHYKSGLKLDRKTKLIIIIAIISSIIVMGSVISARTVLWETRYNAVSSGIPSAATLDTSNFLYRYLPKFISIQIVLLTGYFSQGYRGLALCLLEPFVPTWGMGFSFKIMNDFSNWFNIPMDILEKSYPVRMGHDYGIGAYSSWHTIFPWIASDVGFFGALVVVSFFIYLWANSWKEWLETENLWSLVLFSQLTIMVLYIPCNNQLFQTRESIISTIAIFIVWVIFKGRIREQE